jgi:hypothetical protein
MKKTLLCASILIFFIAANVMADPIQVKVISSSYKVTGSYYLLHASPSDPTDFGVKTGSYSLSGTTPQRGQVNDAYYYDEAGAPPEVVSASSYAGPFGVSSDTSAYGFSSFSLAGSYASSEITFRPLSDFETLDFSFKYYTPSPTYYADINVSLIDLTDGTVVWSPTSAEWCDMWEESLFRGINSGAINYAFRADHLYGLNMMARSGADDDDESARFEFINIQAVPEPALSFLLGVGLLSVVFIGRRFGK